MVKPNRSWIGLPGNVPLTRVVTVLRTPTVSTACGSEVMPYLATASAFQAAMAARPTC